MDHVHTTAHVQVTWNQSQLDSEHTLNASCCTHGQRSMLWKETEWNAENKVYLGLNPMHQTINMWRVVSIKARRQTARPIDGQEERCRRQADRQCVWFCMTVGSLLRGFMGVSLYCQSLAWLVVWFSNCGRENKASSTSKMSLCLALSLSPIRLSLSLADMSDCPSDWVMNLLYQSPLWPLASCQIYCCRDRKIWLPLLQTPSSCLQHLFNFPFPCPFQ